MIINEGLRQNDLQYMVSNYISIDQYTSKLDTDNITVAFFIDQMEAAEDLRDFIEKQYFLEIRDIEISDSMTDDNKNILFVEMERNIMFPKVLIDMLKSVSYLINEKKWFFQGFGMRDKVELNEKSLKKFIRLSKYRADDNEVIAKREEDIAKIEEKKAKEEPKEPKEVEESYEPSNKTIELSKGWFKKEYLDEGYVSENEMNCNIHSSESLNSRDSLEMELLEANFPEYEIITTDDKVFLIKDDKIRQLGE